jgi:UDP-N-acetylmuramate dehydrogenase
MFSIKDNFSLQAYNTFGLNVFADYFVSLSNSNEVKDYLSSSTYKNLPQLILGSGSNLLFISDYIGIIVKPDIQGIEIIEDEKLSCTVRCGAGVNWDSFVAWTVEKQLYGIENLSLIPGTVGASPIQNIGAYGVEAKDYIISVEGFNTHTGEYFKLKNNECKFDYRFSIFKTDEWKNIIVTHVNFKLSKTPDFKTEYGTINEEITKLGGLTQQNLRLAIINIRNAKLPDYNIIGNAGSFFKNPIISKDLAEKIKIKFSDAHLYKLSENNYKIPAAFLIEKLGWKGFREGNVGVYPLQPLIIVNYGNASGTEIFDLANKIKDSVKNNFGIDLEFEVIPII